MIALRAAIAFAVAASAGGAASAQTARDEVYVVDRIRDLISADETVGVKRAGLMCLPNGSLRWSDIALGANLDQREIVQDVLEDAGLRVASLGAAVPARRQFRIRGIVKAANFRLCAKRWGFGDRTHLSGDARLEIEWRAEDAGGGDAGFRHVSTITRQLGPGEAASVGALYRLLLEDAAHDLARWLPNRADTLPR